MLDLNWQRTDTDIIVGGESKYKVTFDELAQQVTFPEWILPVIRKQF